jgi:fructan beta-fructosidase
MILACGKRRSLRIAKNDKGTATIEFQAAKQYLLLPMEDSGREMPMKVSVDGKYLNTFVIRPAQEQIDYWMPIELKSFNQQSVEISMANFEGFDLFLDSLKLSDTFDYDYHEKFRPLFHFTPPYGWMNDPNGMVYYDGEFHLAYQYNPFGTKWQNMSWGHAITKDLVTWEHQQVALWPDTLGAIFSGSAVVDTYNSTGLQSGDEKTLLAYFTHAGPKGQMQSLAFSTDRGRTWTKYADNPVLTNPKERDFRDPKVFWHEDTEKWIMIVAVGQLVEIYSSKNGLNWNLESRFGEGQGAHGGVWECPDLFELQVEGESENSKWILICNINPGGPSGGSASQYFIGNFDGKTFVNENNPEIVKWMDWGKDHYATVTWSNVPETDGRRLAIGWMSNWEYANDVPTKHFRSAMTVVRELKLVRKEGELVLASVPVKELESLRSEAKRYDNLKVEGEKVIESFLPKNSGAYEMTVDIRAPETGVCGFSLMNSRGDQLDVSLDISDKKLHVDRTQSGLIGFSDEFPVVTFAPIAKKQVYHLRLLIDKSSVELFEGRGETVVTNLIFPNEPYNTIRIYSERDTCEVENLTVYKLD